MENKFNDIVLIGDVHNNFRYIDFMLRTKYTDVENTLFIQVGDFGVGFPFRSKTPNRFFGDESLDKLNKRLEMGNNYLYAIRGNHDDPKYWNEQLLPHQHIKLIKDYTVLNINDHNFLFWGGAISIDRGPDDIERIGFDYWLDEHIVFDYDIINNLKNIDYIVTHNSPAYCQPISIIDHPRATNERYQLNLAADIIIKNNDVKKWFYGHFHYSDVEIIGGVEYRILAINEFYHLRELEKKE